jgi:hypothetical protein
MASECALESLQIGQVLRRGVPLAAIWLVLAGAGGEALVVGGALIPLATWLSLRLYRSARRCGLGP